MANRCIFDVDTVEERRAVSAATEVNQSVPRLTSDPVVLVILAILILLGAAFLARQHVMLGRADRRGAWRLGVHVFSLTLISLPLRPHHVPHIGEEYFLLTRLLAWGLYQSIALALLYLAFEPYVRRRWPDMLIGWNRVFAGRFSDPIVGREVLVGSVGGTMAVVVMWFADAAARWQNFTIAPPFRPALEAFREPSHFASLVMFVHVNALGVTLGMVVLLLFLHFVLRVGWLAVTAWIMAILAPGLTVYGLHWTIGLPAGLATATIAAFLLYRFGLLAVWALLFTNHALTRLPAALEFSAWYAGRSLLTLAIVVGIGLYAARTAVGGWSAMREV
jgi:hypothetical protein